jgi:glycosyltransferase involved in cell wall biosynthesis
MRIAQLMAGAPAGGAELFFERLCRGLAEQDDILPVIRRNEARAARLRDAGLAPVQMRFGWGTRWRLSRRLRAFAPRVTVAWMGRAASVAPAGPWVLVGRLGGTYDLRRFARCDHLVGNTKGMVDWIVGQGFPPGRVHLLENFVPDLSNAEPAALPVPPGAPVVLAMGRLHRAKAFDVLVAALVRLPGVHAVVAGEGAERRALEMLARQAGVADRFHLLGWRSDTAALLAACDLLVCPSRVEPLGNVILEAFSAGKPVVAAMAAGPLELIEPGRNGVLVALDSGIALAAGIEAVLGNPAMAAALAQAGRARWEQEFAPAAVIAKWRAFLGKVERVPCAA